MFKRKPKKIVKSKISGMVVYTNDATNICYEASKSCYASKLSYDPEVRGKYINARVREGHSSVTEHSNVVLLLQVPKKYCEDLVEVLASAKFIRSESRFTDDYVYLLIGGSTLAYRHWIADTYNQSNIILKYIKELLYSCCPAYFFRDLIEMGVMDEHKFVDYETTTVFHMTGGNTYEGGFKNYLHHGRSLDESHLEFVNIDPIIEIHEKVKDYGFNLKDIKDFATITIRFIGMSRIITQELTRHRNAITQESQRYVDAKDVKFNSPDMFKDKYDSSKEYEVTIGDAIIKGTLSEIGNDLIGVYKSLRDAGLDREDARAYLPENVQSNLYMTFTAKNLGHFLNLRMDSHAQAEIRKFALDIYNTYFDIYKVGGEDTIDILDETPKCLYEARPNVDPLTEETFGETIETIESNKQAAVPAVGEELPNFGMENNIPKPLSDSDMEAIYEIYNPEKYADTRADDKE